MADITENLLERTTLDWFESLGWQTAFGPDIIERTRNRVFRELERIVRVLLSSV